MLAGAFCCGFNLSIIRGYAGEEKRGYAGEDVNAGMPARM